MESNAKLEMSFRNVPAQDQEGTFFQSLVDNVIRVFAI